MQMQFWHAIQLYDAFDAGSSLRSEVVQIITEELRRKLELTLFGYDIVVEDATGMVHSCILQPTDDMINCVALGL